MLHGPNPVGRRLPDVALPDGSRLYEKMGPEGLLISPPGSDVEPHRRARTRDVVAGASETLRRSRRGPGGDPTISSRSSGDGPLLTEDAVLTVLGGPGDARVP